MANECFYRFILTVVDFLIGHTHFSLGIRLACCRCNLFFVHIFLGVLSLPTEVGGLQVFIYREWRRLRRLPWSSIRTTPKNNITKPLVKYIFGKFFRNLHPFKPL